MKIWKKRRRPALERKTLPSDAHCLASIEAFTPLTPQDGDLRQKIPLYFPQSWP
jgi:hypothetical protein